MLAAGILLANVPGNVVAAFPKKWGIQMRAAALATIFLRCGLELEFKVGMLELTRDHTGKQTYVQCVAAARGLLG